MRIPLAVRLAVIVLLPLALLAWMSAIRIADLREQTEVAVGQARRAQLMVATSRLIDALQRERGTTLAGLAGATVGDLPAARAATDEALAAWHAPVAAAAFAKTPDPAAFAQRLAGLRTGGGGAAEVRDRYNEAVVLLLSLQQTIPNAPTSRGLGKVIAAAAAIEAAKESAAQLRARLPSLARLDKAVPDADYGIVQRCFAILSTGLDAQHQAISEDGLAGLRRVRDGVAWQGVERAVEAIARQRRTGGFALDPAAVFADLSAVIAGLGEVVQHESAAVAARSQAIAGEAEGELRRDVAMLGLGIAGAVLLSLWLGIGMLRGIATARRRLAEVAQGRIASSAVPRQRLTALARRGDELGDLGRDLAAAEAYLGGMAAAAAALAAGDLTARVEARGPHDEFGTAFARMVAALTTAIGQVVRASQSLSAAASQMASTSHQLASNAKASRLASASAASAATQGGAQVQSLAASAEELSASVREVAGSGQRMAGRITETTGSAQAMAEATGKVGGIAASIASIAEQTNLLALNAAIEAAGAGEAGRGFAVVAGEVKQLAHQAAEAAAAIQRTVAELAPRMQALGAGMHEAEGAAQSIAAAVEEQSSTTAEMARGLAETGQALGDITQGAEQVSASIAEVAQGAAQVEQAAQELDRLAAGLRAAVSAFRTGG